MIAYVIKSQAICLLVCVCLLPAQGEIYIWKCSGERSRNTETDCQLSANVEGCYYQKLTKKFVPCYDACEGAQYLSAQHKTCESECRYYHNSNCILQAASITTSTSTPKKSTAHIHTVLIVILFLFVVLYILYKAFRNRCNRYCRRRNTENGAETVECQTFSQSTMREQDGSALMRTSEIGQLDTRPQSTEYMEPHTYEPIDN